MKKDFKQELTELINKHGLEKEMRDTPDYIWAEICIDAMAVFTEAIARRDEWHEFRKADEKSSQDAKHNYPDDCNICKDCFKCADYMRTQPIANLIQRFKTTKDKEEKAAIAGLLKDINDDATGKIETEVPQGIKDIAEKLGKAFGGSVEIHRIEIPGKNTDLERNQESKRHNKRPGIKPGLCRLGTGTKESQNKSRRATKIQKTIKVSRNKRNPLKTKIPRKQQAKGKRRLRGKQSKWLCCYKKVEKWKQVKDKGADARKCANEQKTKGSLIWLFVQICFYVVTRIGRFRKD